MLRVGVVIVLILPNLTFYYVAFVILVILFVGSAIPFPLLGCPVGSPFSTITIMPVSVSWVFTVYFSTIYALMLESVGIGLGLMESKRRLLRMARVTHL